MNAQEFKAKFESKLPSKEYKPGDPCLGDCIESQKLCREMVEAVFYDWEAPKREALFMGVGDTPFGGLTSIYATFAVHTVYDNCFRFLETGWWALGFDKGRFVGNGDYTIETYQQENYFESCRTVFYLQNGGTVIANCETWHYTAAIMQESELHAFVGQIEKDLEGDEIVALEFPFGFIDFEDLKLTGSKFSSVNIESLIAKIGVAV